MFSSIPANLQLRWMFLLFFLIFLISPFFLLSNGLGLHLRSIDQTHNEMPTEQGGTTTTVENVNVRSGVPLPTTPLLSTCQPPHEYDPEYARMESWMDENPEFIQDYFTRWGGSIDDPIHFVSGGESPISFLFSTEKRHVKWSIRGWFRVPVPIVVN